MKITRYVNGQPKEKAEMKDIKISSEIITSTIETVNKRCNFMLPKGLNSSNE